MSDRIIQLAEQCYEYDQSWTGVGQRIFNKEKFAELIIKETMRVVANNTAWNGYINAADAVIKHFGDQE